MTYQFYSFAGAFDLIRQPKNISEYAKKNACFYMFVDEETESFLKNSSALDINKKSGLWRIVVVCNLPYSDPRRNGKVNYFPVCCNSFGSCLLHNLRKRKNLKICMVQMVGIVFMEILSCDISYV